MCGIEPQTGIRAVVTGHFLPLFANKTGFSGLPVSPYGTQSATKVAGMPLERLIRDHARPRR